MANRKILFASHDPGGANVLLPIVKIFYEDLNYQCILILLGPAGAKLYSHFPKAVNVGLSSFSLPDYPNEYSTTETEILAVFQTYLPDIVFVTTSYNSNLERICLKFAKTFQIPNAGIVDFWSNYSQRFYYERKYFYPDILFVYDVEMHDSYKKIGCKSEIIICGNPHFETLQHKIKHNVPSNTKQKKIIRFFSENIWHYFPNYSINEFSIVNILINYFEINQKHIDFIVRPHPMESHNLWNKYLADKNQECKYVSLYLDSYNLYDALANTDISIGISSMVLFESSIIGIPTYSYQIDIPEEQVNSIPLEEYGIQILKYKTELPDLLEDHNKINKNPTVLCSMEIIKSRIDNVL